MQLIIDDACPQMIPGSVIRNGMFFVNVRIFFNSHRIGIRFIENLCLEYRAVRMRDLDNDKERQGNWRHFKCGEGNGYKIN